MHTVTSDHLPSGADLKDRILLRPNLVLHSREAGSVHLVLEDTANGKFYRLGLAEGQFLAQLQLHRSISRARLACQDQDPDAFKASPLNEQQITALCAWLCESGFLESPDQPHSDQGTTISERSLTAKFFYYKLSLINPDRILAVLLRYADSLFAWQVSILTVTLFLLGAVTVAGRWSEFLESYENLWTPWNGLWLSVCWMALKAIHELAHGATCKRYGGEVREAGVAFILFIPVAFVDVTTSWRFPSRWQRLHVTLAGILAELTVAGIALWVWHFSDSLMIKHAAADVVLLVTLSSLLFNLNPLLRFDGYYALADITAVDNLYALGQSYWRYWKDRYLLGMNPTCPNLPNSHAWWIKPYAIAAAVWRGITLVTLIVAAATLLQGVGILLAVAGTCHFIVMPAVRWIGTLRRLHARDELNLTKLGTRLSVITALCGLILYVSPGDLHQTAPAVVEYDPPLLLRAPADGFVLQVHVVNGQLVKQGDLLMTLRSDLLQSQIAASQKELAKSQQALRSAQWNQDPSKKQLTESAIKGTREHLDELMRKQDNLTIRAPTAGQVIARNIENLAGTYLHEGDEVGAIGCEQTKRVKFSICQEVAAQAERWRAAPLKVILTGQGTWNGELSLLESRASNTPPDLSLCSHGGGWLPSLKRDHLTLLTEPRVNGYVKLPRELGEKVLCGQRCAVKLAASRPSLASRLWQCLNESIFLKAFVE